MRFLGGASAVAGSKERTWFKEQLWWMMMVNNWHDGNGMRLESG
jgi:hypothetical protein